MGKRDPFQAVDIDTMMEFVSSIFAELNIGLLIYHLEEPGDPYSLRLIYANRVASEYTEADLEPLVGMTIDEAFPALMDTDVPATYMEVATSQKPVNLGAFEYGGDEHVGQGYYAVKAFPMPNACVGIVFENITLRKQLEAMVRKERGKGSDA